MWEKCCQQLTRFFLSAMSLRCTSKDLNSCPSSSFSIETKSWQTNQFQCKQRIPPKKILPKISPKKFLQKNSAKKIPPKILRKNSLKISKKIKKITKKIQKFPKIFQKIFQTIPKILKISNTRNLTKSPKPLSAWFFFF